MSFTREERLTIEKLIKKVRKLEKEKSELKLKVDALEDIINAIDAESNILDWSSSQIEEFLKPYILKYMRKGVTIPLHDHTNYSQGGDCFAKLGANLINGD
jgi:hypothetical protein